MPQRLAKALLRMGGLAVVAALLSASSSGLAIPPAHVQAQVPTPTPTPLPTFVFTVTSTSDGADSNLADFTCNDGSGACTLRAAIQQANSLISGNQSFKDTIRFNIPTSDPGYMTSTPTWWRIQPTSALPKITDPVVIDGYTQPGASPNTNTVESGLGLNTVLKIEVDGTLTGCCQNGLTVSAGSSAIKGLAINRFGQGVEIVTTGENVLEGNFIGTDVTGSSDLGNILHGVSIPITANNVVGGTMPKARNVISGNDNNGVKLGGSGNLVQGNLLGTDLTGNISLGNSASGVMISSGSNNTVGGTGAGARNIISGNGSQGIFISGINATGNVIKGNYIGTDASGTSALGNSVHGVIVTGDALGNTVGGTASGTGNIIAYNGGDGVLAESGTGNAVLGNAIFSNGGLGIDLAPNGVTPNDVGDADTGPNNLQNFPAVASAISEGGSTTIQGTLNSTPNTTFRVEFFSNPTCDASGYGEGKTFLGFANVTTNGSGNAPFTASFPPAVAVGQVITATATDPSGNTSEFSACQSVAAAPVPTPTPTPLPGVSGLGLGVMAGLLLAASFWAYRRQRRRATAASGQ